jgi:hypothetical protein
MGKKKSLRWRSGPGNLLLKEALFWNKRRLVSNIQYLPFQTY